MITYKVDVNSLIAQEKMISLPHPPRSKQRKKGAVADPVPTVSESLPPPKLIPLPDMDVVLRRFQSFPFADADGIEDVRPVGPARSRTVKKTEKGKSAVGSVTKVEALAAGSPSLSAGASEFVPGTLVPSSVTKVVLANSSDGGARANNAVAPESRIVPVATDLVASIAYANCSETVVRRAQRLHSYYCPLPACGGGGGGGLVFPTKEQLIKHIEAKHTSHISRVDATTSSTGAKQSDKTLCSVCLSQSSLFVEELKLFTRAELIAHINGKCASPGNKDGNAPAPSGGGKRRQGGRAGASDTPLDTGHPVCMLCLGGRAQKGKKTAVTVPGTVPPVNLDALSCYCYDAAQLYQHMNMDHYQCSLCRRQDEEAGGEANRDTGRRVGGGAAVGLSQPSARSPAGAGPSTNSCFRFYPDQAALNRHYHTAHHVCDYHTMSGAGGGDPCEGLVWATEVELILHYRSFHYHNAKPSNSAYQGITTGGGKAGHEVFVDIDMSLPNPNLIQGSQGGSRGRRKKGVGGDSHSASGGSSDTGSAGGASNTLTSVDQLPAHMQVAGYVTGSGIFHPDDAAVGAFSDDPDMAMALLRDSQVQSEAKGNASTKLSYLNLKRSNATGGGSMSGAGSGDPSFPVLASSSSLPGAPVGATGGWGCTGQTGATAGPSIHPMSLIPQQRAKAVAEREKQESVRLAREQEQERLRVRNSAMANALGLSSKQGIALSLAQSVAVPTGTPETLAAASSAPAELLSSPKYSAVELTGLLETPLYTQELILYCHENMKDVLKIEKKYFELCSGGSGGTATAGTSSVSFAPMSRVKRRVVIEIGRYYNVLNYEYDEEPARYVSAVRTVHSAPPARSLSRVCQSVLYNLAAIKTLNTPGGVVPSSAAPVIYFTNIIPRSREEDPMGAASPPHYINKHNKHYNINGTNTSAVSDSVGGNMYVCSVLDVVSRLVEAYKTLRGGAGSVRFHDLVASLEVLYFNTLKVEFASMVLAERIHHLLCAPPCLSNPSSGASATVINATTRLSLAELCLVQPGFLPSVGAEARSPVPEPVPNPVLDSESGATGADDDEWMMVDVTLTSAATANSRNGHVQNTKPGSESAVQEPVAAAEPRPCRPRRGDEEGDGVVRIREQMAGARVGCEGDVGADGAESSSISSSVGLVVDTVENVDASVSSSASLPTSGIAGLGGGGPGRYIPPHKRVGGDVNSASLWLRASADASDDTPTAEAPSAVGSRNPARSASALATVSRSRTSAKKRTCDCHRSNYHAGGAFHTCKGNYNSLISDDEEEEEDEEEAAEGVVEEGDVPVPAASEFVEQTAWACSACTFLNDGLMERCEVCENHR